MNKNNKIVKSNELIAEFMGISILYDEYFLPQHTRIKFEEFGEWEYTNLYEAKKLEYHNSWNWLMPVAIKINTHSYELEGQAIANKLYSALGMAEITTVYKYVVAFVKWYLRRSKKQAKMPFLHKCSQCGYKVCTEKVVDSYRQDLYNDNTLKYLCDRCDRENCRDL